jgi:uncharacterized protein YqjF (DUF2071 family)
MLNGPNMKPGFLTAEWRDLVMLNYPVESSILAPHVPRGTELDEWDGNTFISLVAFSFLNTRVKRIPVPFHRDFEEINLRFYVRFKGPEGWRRGVVFVREVVPKRAIASIARWLYNENYVACPTRSNPRHAADGSQIREYGWCHKDKWLSIGATYSGSPSLPKEGSEEEFISEHYWGYTSQRDGSTVEYRVEHPQWNVWPASDHVASGDFAEFYGPEFAAALAGPPSSAFVADGSAVIVREGTQLEQDARRPR